MPTLQTDKAVGCMWKEESNELREQKRKTWYTLDGEREKEASVHSCEAFYFTQNTKT